MKKSNINSDNQPNQTPDHLVRKTKRSDEKTAAASYQKLPR